MNRKNNMVIGVIFVILGIMFLLGNLNIINIRFSFLDIGFFFAYFWPALFLILPGLTLHSVFFTGKNRDAGVLVPAGILLTTGITSQISMLFGLWHVMWPGFILAVAIGLFELYLFGNRDKGLLIPVSILTVISLIFFDVFSFRALFGLRFRQFIIPGILILIGLSVIFRNNPRKDDEFK